MFTHKRRGALVLVVLAALILFFFVRLAFSNLILARGDTFLYFYPYWTAAAEALRAGRLPLWNPDLFMGAPFLANSQVGFFYPLNWPVWLLFAPPYAVSASILIHVLIAAAGTYLAGRRALGLARGAALLAAALFALGGYLTAQVEHVNQLQGLAWLPWFFAVLPSLVDPPPTGGRWRDTLRPVLAIGGLLALQLLAGHTQTAFISGVAVALWVAIHSLPDFRKPVRSGAMVRPFAALAAAVALAAVLAAAQLLPTLELAGQSTRQGGLPLNEVLSFSWHPLHLTRALLPGYGQTLFSEYVAFLPLTALALAVVGAWGWRRNRAVRPWVFLVVVAMVLALGRFTPLYYLLGRLPGFDLFRAPARWLAVAALGLALLAGYGWQRLRAYATADYPTDEARRVARAELLRPLIVAAVGLALLIVWGYAAGWLARFVPTGAEAPYAPPALLTLLGWLIEFVLAALLLWVILTGPTDRAATATRDLAVLTLAVLWLGSRGLPYNQLTTPEAYFDLRPPQARLMALATCRVPARACPTPPDRFLSLSGILFDPGDLAEIEAMYADQLDAAAIYDYVIAVKHKEVLSPNLSLVSGLPAIDGFDGGILPLRSYAATMGLILPEGNATTDGRLREYLPAAPDARWLSLFNGRYLITDKTGDAWREGVYFDRQHPVNVRTAVAVAAPDFEATELWLLADGPPPEIEIITEGQVWRATPALWLAPDVYRVTLPQPATVETLTLLPCAAGPEACGLDALTLVDSRDGAFLPLSLPPYRLIFSGDVKIYENADAQPRAFLVHDWQWAADGAAAVAAMRAEDFDPRAEAVVIGIGDAAVGGAGGQGVATISDYTAESVLIQTRSDRDSLLILTDAHYPGWAATVDGAPGVIEQVDGMFRGVFLPAGEHEVAFHYRPRSVRLGLALSLLGLGLALAATVGVFVTKRWDQD
ncbi:YfhO family protein [Candidatus Promineifilum breve]|uniref:YfhO family protein n=1 Tax=Candidatus Promineifilum breve TaxID=1806508 RepID=UPI0012FF772E|nr:YfhO family protein [Candidatus Promineifilum breve]